MRTRDPAKQEALRRQALEMIVKEGLDGLSMQKLAKAAHVSPATIYVYYEHREDLILQLYRETMKQMSQAALEGFDPEMPFAEGLRVQWHNRARFLIENPLEAQFLEQIRYSPLYERVHAAEGRDFADAMQKFVKNAIRRKELVKVPSEIYWSVAFAPLYQLVKMHLHGRGFPGGEPFALDKKTLQLSFDLVRKALTP